MTPQSVPTGPRLVPVMRTKDRSPQRNYLLETVRGLRGLYHPASSWDILPLQVVDTGVATPAWPHELVYVEQQHGAVLHLAPERLTNNQNGLRALEVGLATGAEWILHLEDDVTPCAEVGRSITDWLEDHGALATEAPCITFFTPYAQVGKVHRAGQASWRYPVKDFYGNQAWVMSRQMAGSAVQFLQGRIPVWRSTQGFDMLLKAWMAEVLGATHLLAAAPCFFQHVGEQSGLNNRFFQTGNWPGAGWTYTKRGAGR